MSVTPPPRRPALAAPRNHPVRSAAGLVVIALALALALAVIFGLLAWAIAAGLHSAATS